jgi:hypothetical protein
MYVGDVQYLFGAPGAFYTHIQGGHGQANLSLSVQHHELGIELFAHNVTDRRAAEATGDPAQGGYVYLIRPREIGLEVRNKFDQPWVK